MGKPSTNSPPHSRKNTIMHVIGSVFVLHYWFGKCYVEMDQENLELNKDKTKVVRLVDSKKTKFKWFVKGAMVEEQESYKYVGIKIGRGTTHKEHKLAIKAKAQSLIFAFKALYKKLDCPNHNHIIKVMAAQILPSLSYGLVTWCGKEADLLNELQTKIYKAVFNLPKVASSSQVRLEFGLQNQKLRGMSGFVKLCHKFRSADPDILNRLCWEEVKHQMDLDSPNSWGSHLRTSLDELEVQTAWDNKADRASISKAVNGAAKKKSFLEDKKVIAKRRHGWTVINSYKLLMPQAYLTSHFSLQLKKSFTDYWMGLHDSKDLKPSWKNTQQPEHCRLCGFFKETLAHLLCACPAVIGLRRQYLKSIFNELKIRTCRQAVTRWMEGSSITLACRGVKFLSEVRKLLRQANLEEHSDV